MRASRHAATTRRGDFLKIRIEETYYTGTPEEIMDMLRQETSVPIATAGEYIRFVQDNLQRMTGQPCPLDGGSTGKRAKSLIRHLAAIGALEVLEE